MLSDDAERYIALRRTLGYKLVKAGRHLHAFARFAAERGDTYIRTATALAWAVADGRTQGARDRRLVDVAMFARCLHAEDDRHEVPPSNLFAVRRSRPIPYIYTPDEIARILDAAGALRHQRPNPLRRELYVMMFGLIAATGLRVSEAIALELDDVWPDGILHIRETKFCKSRLVPLHPTVVGALRRYLEIRRRLAGASDYLFPSVQHRALCPSTVNYTFRCALRRAKIAPDRSRQPRVHDLRHTFATRVLEQCGAERGAVARHFVALSTYLGHADIRHTYWYLEATPELMTDIAAAAEVLVASDVA
ncbi:putative integrase/recombinase y4rB (plasmid) [Beijerinckiaceae bacterium RH AL1]|nr:tyrosine-type recombinase/integrase [Beijerinckiaceae bacterium]VVB50222.1 putative integrase/recombinase y4rB [Beijerinckiaceae bacterium RH CH11]VVB50231.1 putative integrase/recombinase y4rB [Beijerinckiaceae bacterium RH AL8]VVC57283.1 putative integrase/recombinase y4rB [Beijerinckiaceae bacterium RH AL1]